MMSHETMKKTLLTACAAAALVIGAGHGASAQVNTVCAGPTYPTPNPAGQPLTYPSQPGLCLFGGGSSLAAIVYQAQALGHYGVTDPTFGLNYSSIGSGAGHNMFLNNLFSYDTNNITPNGPVIAFGASDATLTPAQISTWTTATFGQPVSGNLIQIPTFGTTIAIVFKKTTHQQSGGLLFTDDQLCGIFSGLITTWADSRLSTVALSGSTLPTGIIHPTYRLDSSGTSFLLTQHFAAVCHTSGTDINSAINFSANTTFASEFPSGVPTNFVGASNSSGIQTTIQTTGNTANGDLGYLSPDYTLIAPVNAGHAGFPAVAQVKNGTDGQPYLPSAGSGQSALSTVTPPGPGDTAPNDYVPPVANPPHDYPIVGFTTVNLAQCYSSANTTVGFDIVEYWTDFYNAPYMASLLLQHGFSPLPTGLSTAVVNNLFTVGATGNTDVMEPNVCASAAAAYGFGSGTIAGR